MTLNEFNDFAMRMKSMYQKENIMNNDYTMSLWYEHMADLDYGIAKKALDNWFETEKWSPSLSDIRHTYSLLVNGEYAPWSSEWEKVEYAVRSKYGRYRKEEALNSFTEITRRCVLALGWDNLCDSENIMADRAHFGRIYEELSSKKRERNMMSEQIKNLIDTATSRREQLEIKMNTPSLEIKMNTPSLETYKNPQVVDAGEKVELSDRVQDLLRKTREELKGE